MAGDLGAELKQYTINILNSLGSEVDKQFEKWARPEIGFLAQLCRAQQAAVKEQAEVLNELAEDQRRSYERSLFVLEILTIPATSWLLATLELKVGKKIFYEYEGAMVQVHDIPWVALPKTRVWNEYNSKIFGDMGKEIADSLSKLAGEKFLANDHEDVNPHSVAYSPNAGVFALNLHAEVYKQQRQIKDTILKITQDIARSMTFGRALVQRLRSENPHFDRLPYEAQLKAGQKMFNDMLDMNRETWAGQWIYYGNDPPSPDWGRVKRELERQIWRLWIVQQHFRAEKSGFPPIDAVMGASGDVLEATGGVLFPIKTSPIVTRLDEFNAPVWDYILKKRPMDAQAQVNKLNDWAKREEPTWLNRELEGKRRVLKPVDEMW